MPGQPPALTRISPALAEVLARMVEAKLAAERRTQVGRLTVSSDDPSNRELHEGRRHAR
jgi:hypothetical protein